jgi:hypothetical protein
MVCSDRGRVPWTAHLEWRALHPYCSEARDPRPLTPPSQSADQLAFQKRCILAAVKYVIAKSIDDVRASGL